MKYLDDSHRMFDSRDFKDGPVPAGDYTFDLPSVIPNCSTIALTVTVVNPIGKGHVTLWAKGPIADDPASKLNYHIENIANSTTVNIDNRRFRLYLSKAAHLILDIDGYQ